MQVGPYTVVNELGRGGMGVVYKAHDAQGHPVALKLLLAHAAGKPRVRERFRRETQALARLNHPHVVRLHSAGEHEGIPYLALDFAEGESLDDRLRTGPLPVHEAIRVGQQLADALAYVHSRGLLHRDVKPANVILAGRRALLTDFGLVLDDDTDGNSRITNSGVFMGTPGYWAPEQAQGKTDAFGPWTDLYGLGAVLYACLTGEPPVQAPTIQAFFLTQAFRHVEPPREVRPEVPAWLSELCMQCLAPEREARPSSADEVARALLTAGRLAQPGRRAWLPGLAIGASLLLATGSVGLALHLYRSPSPDVARSEPPHATPTPPPPTEAAPGPGKTFAQVRHQVGLLLQAKRFEDACVLAKRLSKLDPANPVGFHVQAVTLQLTNRHAEAVLLLDRALELSPSAQLYGQRARSHDVLGNTERALSDYSHSLALHPRSFTNLQARAELLSSLGQTQQALADLNRALELKPLDAPTHARRATELLLFGRVDEALAASKRAVQLDPQLAAALVARGTSYAELGEHALARADAERALKLDPRSPFGWRILGHVAYQREEFAEAIELYGNAIEFAPRSGDTFGLRAAAKLALGQIEQALADLNRSLELSPDYTASLVNRGLILNRLKRFDEALVDLERAVTLEPDDVPAIFNRGVTLSGLGRLNEAIEAFDRTLELDPPGTALLFLRRAVAYANKEAFTQALADAERGLALNPGNVAADLEYTRARALQRLRRHTEAVEGFDRVLEHEADFVRVFFSRAASHFNLGNYEAAIEDYTTSLKHVPNDAHAITYRARAKLRLGREAEARADFELATTLSPRSSVVWSSRINSLQTLDEFARAAEHLKATLRDHGEQGWLRHHLGRCQLRLGKRQSALENFARALKLEAPENVDDRERLHIWSAIAHALEGRLEQAREEARGATFAHPGSHWGPLWVVGFGGDPATLAPHATSEHAWIRALVAAFRSESFQPDPVFAACAEDRERDMAAAFLGLLAERRNLPAQAQALYTKAAASAGNASLPVSWARLRRSAE